MNYHIYKCVKNTNEEIKFINSNFNQNFSNLALFSQLQTHGRGRGSNLWISKKGDFTSSFLFNKKLELSKLGQINLLVVDRLIKLLEERIMGVNFNFKWPNDIYFNEMKLAGILIETTIQKQAINSLIIGIGINLISCPKFEDKKTVRLTDFSQKISSLNLFFSLSKILEEYFDNFQTHDFSKLSKELTLKILKKNKIIKIKQNNKIINGKLIKVDEFGALVIQTVNGYKHLTYGETL